jgi:hypothetical protein
LCPQVLLEIKQKIEIEKSAKHAKHFFQFLQLKKTYRKISWAFINSQFNNFNEEIDCPTLTIKDWTDRGSQQYPWRPSSVMALIALKSGSNLNSIYL